jgi:Asp-tRNA(Asn)/Glu-tRNA(Gln) amidotransferase A subunit family amidase
MYRLSTHRGCGEIGRRKDAIGMIKNPRIRKSGLVERLDKFESLFTKKQPQIHAFLPEENRSKRLAEEAKVLQKQYPKREKRPPLYGLLLGVKDIFQVDGFPTHAGSFVPAKELNGKEASSVSKLKKAGMLLAGKTVTTEFAYFAPGPTRNPHNTDHTPGGSSSGSAAAVAAGLVDLALGTQTIGSIIRPASFCGVIGFKPSYGRISADGVIPLAPSFDHVGLFSHYLDLIARALNVLIENWRNSPPQNSKPFLAVPVGEYFQQADREMQVQFDNTVDCLKAASYQVKKINPFKNFKAVADRHNLILAAQAAQVHAAWYESYKYLYQSKTAALIERGQKVKDAELKEALQEVGQFKLDLSTLMDIHGIDAWISPAAIGAAPHGLASTGDPVMNLPWTQAGFPALALPGGMSSTGLPLGLQITADFNHDEDLVSWGSDIEKALAQTS